MHVSIIEHPLKYGTGTIYAPNAKKVMKSDESLLIKFGTYTFLCVMCPIKKFNTSFN